jgi:hypothetical protein
MSTTTKYFRRSKKFIAESRKAAVELNPKNIEQREGIMTKSVIKEAVCRKASVSNLDDLLPESILCECKFW